MAKPTAFSSRPFDRPARGVASYVLALGLALEGCAIDIPRTSPCVRRPETCSPPPADSGADVSLDAAFDVARDLSPSDVTRDLPRDIARVCSSRCTPPQQCIAGNCIAPPPRCDALRSLDPELPSGTYTLHPVGTEALLEVFCDFTPSSPTRSFLLGGDRSNLPVEILGGCPAGTLPFPVRSPEDARALATWLRGRPGGAMVYWANSFAGPSRLDDAPAVCPSLSDRVGWLRAPDEWLASTLARVDLPSLDLSRHCNRGALWAPVPWTPERGASNPAGATGRLFAATETVLDARVVCTVDLPGCHPLRADCNGEERDACEVDLLLTSVHCGACGQRCPPTGSASTNGRCTAGRCGCVGGWGDCDTRRSNGCETDLSARLEHCGACGRRCEGGAHAQAVCASGGCALRCDAGYGDCNDDRRDGCETELRANRAHCGLCGVVCGGACSLGRCTP